MIAIALLLVAAAPSAAPPPPAPPTMPAPVRGAAALKALGMSDAGIAVMRQQSTPDPDAKALLAKRQALRQQMATAAAAKPFDLDAFTALIRESSLQEASVRARNEERIITTLKALPPADRPIFAKAVFAGPQRPDTVIPPPQKPLP